MSKITLVLTYLACAGSGWRVQAPGTLHVRRNSLTPRMDTSWLDDLIQSESGTAPATPADADGITEDDRPTSDESASVPSAASAGEPTSVDDFFNPNWDVTTQASPAGAPPPASGSSSLFSVSDMFSGRKSAAQAASDGMLEGELPTLAPPVTSGSEPPSVADFFDSNGGGSASAAPAKSSSEKKKKSSFKNFGF